MFEVRQRQTYLPIANRSRQFFFDRFQCFFTGPFNFTAEFSKSLLCNNLRCFNGPSVYQVGEMRLDGGLGKLALLGRKAFAGLIALPLTTVNSRAVPAGSHNRINCRQLAIQQGINLERQ